MTTTAPVPTASVSGHRAPGGPRVGEALPTRERRSALVALAVVLVVGLAAVGAYLYTQAGKKVPVVVVTTDVPAGHTITRRDLSTVGVAGLVTALGAARLESVVGQTAAVELLPNTLLQRAMLTTGPTIGTGQAQVGVEVKPGQIPADGLNIGDTVEVLGLPDKNAASSTATTAGGGAGPRGGASVLVASATVFATEPDPSASGGTLLTLDVPTAAAAGVAAASNAGLIALVRVGR